MYYKTVTHISTTRVRDRYEGGRPVVYVNGESEEEEDRGK